jgi:uncharacterized protein YqhQ
VTVRAGVSVIVGIIVFTLIDLFLTSIITGTDSGSHLLQTILRVVVAAVIIIGVVKSIGGGKK